MLPRLATDSPLHTIAVLLLAMMLDAVFGDPPMIWRHIPHPAVLAGRAIGFLDERLNRERRSDRDRSLRGLLSAAGLTLLSIALGIGVERVLFASPLGMTVEAVLVSTLIAQNGLYRHVRDVGTALDRDGAEAARVAVGRIVGRETSVLDEAGIARAAIESLAENFADAVVAPVFWFLLFGLPGVLALKTVNTMDSMIGHMTERHRAFGMAAARLDDAMMLIPARIAGGLIALAAIFVPRARPWAAMKTMFRDHGNHASPNSGWPEAAMAGALGLSLGGPRRYPGHVASDPWIGTGRISAAAADIGSALAIYLVACLLDAGLVVSLAVLELGAA